MPRRKEYREYWCGCLKCFICALWYNGTVFHRITAITQLVLIAFTVASPFLAWLEFTYFTGNHLERVRKVFDFFDGNANNVLDFSELSVALKEVNQVFFGSYYRNDAEMIRAVLADRSSGCLETAVKSLQAKCAVGNRATCLGSAQWIGTNNQLMKDPIKLQNCIFSLMDENYLKETGDDCVSSTIKTDWLLLVPKSNEAKCVQRTEIDIQEFSLYARQLVPGQALLGGDSGDMLPAQGCRRVREQARIIVSTSPSTASLGPPLSTFLSTLR
eukprot:353647-Hanusia_phi.AAC.1